MIQIFRHCFSFLPQQHFFPLGWFGKKNTSAAGPSLSDIPDRILNKLQNVSSQEALLRACLKWRNPEIRDAVIPRLNRESIARLLDSMGQDPSADQDVLRIFHSLENENEQRFVRGKCKNDHVRKMLSAEIENARISRIEESKDQKWLASVVMDLREDYGLRLKALEHLEDQERIAKLAVRCLENRDRAFLQRLTDKLEDPERIAELASVCVFRKDETCLKQLLSKQVDPLSLMEMPPMKSLLASQLLWYRQFVRCDGRHEFERSYRSTHLACVEGGSSAETGTGSRDPSGLVLALRCCCCGQRSAHTKPLDSHRFWDIPRDDYLRKVQFPEYKEICTADSQKELAKKVKTGNKYMWLRVAAAEHITDPKLILSLLSWNETGAEAEALRRILIWQLPFDFDFESIVTDPSFPYSVRQDALSRIWDAEALDRIAAAYPYQPDEETRERIESGKVVSINSFGGEDGYLGYLCHLQRCQAMCIHGHDWQLIGNELVMQDESDWGSLRWNEPHYRCSRCGLTKTGEWVQC